MWQPPPLSAAILVLNQLTGPGESLLQKNLWALLLLLLCTLVVFGNVLVILSVAKVSLKGQCANHEMA